MNDLQILSLRTDRVFARQVIHVDCQQVLAKIPVPFEMLDRRTQSAIRHIALIAAQPIMHLPFAASEHFKLLGGLGDMGAQTPAALSCGFRTEPQQLWNRRIRRVGREPGT